MPVFLVNSGGRYKVYLCLHQFSALINIKYSKQHVLCCDSYKIHNASLWLQWGCYACEEKWGEVLARLMLRFCSLSHALDWANYCPVNLKSHPHFFWDWSKYVPQSRELVSPCKSSCHWPFGGNSCSKDMHQWSRLSEITPTSCSGNTPHGIPFMTGAHSVLLTVECIRSDECLVKRMRKHRIMCWSSGCSKLCWPHVDLKLIKPWWKKLILHHLHLVLTKLNILLNIL